MLPPDYHMHTSLCGHAKGEPIDYAANALRLGLKTIGFSDHAPRSKDGLDDWRMRQSDLETYVAKVEQARQAHPSLEILLALEVDYLPDEVEWIQNLSQLYSWDYLIGSVHYVDAQWAVDNPEQLQNWEKEDVDEVWNRYIERLIEAAESGFFNILGHIDLCKKFGHFPKRDMTAQWDRLFASVKDRGIAIELNTAGLRKQCQEIYPSATLLHQAKRWGIPITFGSDAHAPNEVGMNFDAALKLARNAGYQDSVYFNQRESYSCRFT